MKQKKPNCWTWEHFGSASTEHWVVHAIYILLTSQGTVHCTLSSFLMTKLADIALYSQVSCPHALYSRYQSIPKNILILTLKNGIDASLALTMQAKQSSYFKQFLHECSYIKSANFHIHLSTSMTSFLGHFLNLDCLCSSCVLAHYEVLPFLASVYIPSHGYSWLPHHVLDPCCVCWFTHWIILWPCLYYRLYLWPLPTYWLWHWIASQHCLPRFSIKDFLTLAHGS